MVAAPSGGVHEGWMVSCVIWRLSWNMRFTAGLPALVKGEGQAQSKTIGGKQKDPAVMATVGSGGGASTAS